MPESYDIDFSQFGILQRDETTLSQRSRDVVFPADVDLARAVCADLAKTMNRIKSLYPFSHGCGIAAPQIGAMLRVTAIMMPEDKAPHFYINPRITDHSEKKILDYEGCLSFWKSRGRVWRPQTITIAYLDQNGESHTSLATDGFARLMCHEIDHLDGMLYDQKMPATEMLMDLDIYQAARKTGTLTPPQSSP